MPHSHIGNICSLWSCYERPWCGHLCSGLKMQRNHKGTLVVPDLVRHSLDVPIEMNHLTSHIVTERTLVFSYLGMNCLDVIVQAVFSRCLIIKLRTLVVLNHQVSCFDVIFQVFTRCDKVVPGLGATNLLLLSLLLLLLLLLPVSEFFTDFLTTFC
jgi:hypothetical protein